MSMYTMPLAITHPATGGMEGQYLKGAAAPPAAGPFNSTLHTGDPILGLNVVLLYFITYALHWWHVVSSCVVVNLFLALRALCLAC